MITKEMIDEYSRRVQASNEQQEEPFFNNYEELLNVYKNALLINTFMSDRINKRLMASVLTKVKKIDEIQNHLLKVGCVVDTFYLDNDIDFIFSCFKRLSSMESIDDIMDIENAIRYFIDNVEKKLIDMRRMSNKFVSERNNDLLLLKELKVSEKGKYDILHE